MKNNLIGIDLGGTKIEIVILDTNKEIQFRERVPTESKKGPSHIINQILVLYKKAAAFINNAPHTIGVGSPGSLSPKTKLLRNSNTLCLNGLPLQQLIEQALQKKNNTGK
jgi:fructokinase